MFKIHAYNNYTQDSESLKDKEGCDKLFTFKEAKVIVKKSDEFILYMIVPHVEISTHDLNRSRAYTSSAKKPSQGLL